MSNTSIASGVIALILFILISSALAYLLRPRTPKGAPKLWFYTAAVTQTPTELKFFKLLNAAFPEMTVAPQVAFSALAKVDTQKTSKEHQRAAISHIARKRVDYVLFETATGQPVCVIELDDHSHDGPGMKEKDRERDAILRSAGHKTFRFDIRNGITKDFVRKTIDAGTR